MLFESENVHTSTKLLRIVLDSKYKNTYLNKVTKNEFRNLTKYQQRYSHHLLD